MTDQSSCHFDASSRPAFESSPDNDAGASDGAANAGSSSHDDAFDPEADRLREECGVFGIFGHPDAAAITALGLHALQHRGQEGAGITSRSTASSFHSERRLGLVGDNFSKVRGGHQSTAGHGRRSAMSRGTPPTGGNHASQRAAVLRRIADSGGFALAHNGNLSNGLTLASRTDPRGGDLPGDLGYGGRSSISWRAVASQPLRSTVSSDALGRTRGRVRVRRDDPTRSWSARATRSASVRSCSVTWMVCPILTSETCALDIIGARYIRDIANGEIVVHRRRPGRRESSSLEIPEGAGCDPDIFEYVYFSRPDSVVRRPLPSTPYVRTSGADLARGRGTRRRGRGDPGAGFSGVPAAIGYASGVRHCRIELGIIRNHYVGRTFIQPTQSVRELGVRMKHSAPTASVDGGSSASCLVDDSIVRGTTSLQDRPR